LNYFRQDEIFLYEDELYKYTDLKDLRQKAKRGFKEGEVMNTETGIHYHILELERFHGDAILIDVTPALEANSFAPSEVQEVNRKILTKTCKDFFDDIKSKMKDDTVTYEEVMKYWEIKRTFKDFDYKYSNFIKMNNDEDSISMLDNLSLLNKGRTLALVRLVSGKSFKENHIFIAREDLMSLLQFESKDALRHFLASLEANEIIYRKNKSAKLNIEFVINPFLFNRIQSITLTTDIFQMFPLSFKLFTDIDVYYYFKMLSEKQLLKFETTEN